MTRTADDNGADLEPWQLEYNRRRSYLRSIGTAIPDRYGQDQYDDESDPTGAERFWQGQAAEKAREEAQEQAWAAADERARAWLPKGKAL